MRLAFLFLLAVVILSGAPVFTLSAPLVETYDFTEVTVRTAPLAGNPFLTAALTEEFGVEGEPAAPVDGFCDSPDGSLFRIRFMATKPGGYRFAVKFHSADGEASWQGSFRATAGKRRGLVLVDPAYPAHFLWEGTGEHYFWNGLTTYALMGWQDEDTIHAIIDRAARLKVNRLRVTLVGPGVENAERWYEPVKPSAQFRFLFGPWVGAHPDDVHNPGWDVTRYDTAYWQKYERLVRYAREARYRRLRHLLPRW